MAIIFHVPSGYTEVTGMKIERVTVHGFKNIMNTTLRFGNIIALVSLNGFGKSNLLHAIDFGIEFITADRKLKTKMMSWPYGVPLNKQLAKEDFKFELEMVTSTSSDKFRVIYGYQFRWIRNNNEGARIVGEWLKVKKDEKGQKYSLLISRDNNSARYKKAETGRCTHPIAIEPNDLIINKLQAYDNLFFIDIVKGINSLSAHIERHLDAEDVYYPNPIIRIDAEKLHIDNYNNLPRVIFHLKEQHPNKYELLINSFKLLFPNIQDVQVGQASVDRKIYDISFPEDVPFRIDDKVYMLIVKDRNLNQQVTFEHMSDGAKRIFLHLTCIILADINNISLVGIEEPDNCIHPSLFQQLLVILSQLTGNCRIVISSHSPYLVQFLDPQNIYVGLPSENGVARFCRFRPSSREALLKAATDEGVTLGDYIFDLMSGSEEDREELIRYLEVDW